MIKDVTELQKSEMVIDPFGPTLIRDYSDLFDKKLVEPFNINKFPNPNRLMRRGIVFAHTGIETILDAIGNKKEFYTLTGIRPTFEKLHLGNKLVVENMIYFQKLGAKTYVLVADIEAASIKNVPYEEGKRIALGFHIPAYIALGLDPKKTIFYFQSENIIVNQLAPLFTRKITNNEFEAIYGYEMRGPEIFSSFTQAADILFPQKYENKSMPGVIPVGIDQSPHIRLARDVARKSKSIFNFILPAGFYNKFTPSLNGEFKMSKSVPGSYIEIPEDIESVTQKIKNTLTGGGNDIDEQQRVGGKPEKCMVFELLRQHLIEDDNELDEIRQKCVTGKMVCGKCKAYTTELMKKFMEDFNKKFKEAKTKKIQLLRNHEPISIDLSEY